MQDIRELHYDLKRKLNKLDSKQYRNLLIPEIDLLLNEAMTIFVKTIAEPRYAKSIGFEINQRSIDDIRALVVNQVDSKNTCIQVAVCDEESYLAPLPDDYWFYLKSRAMVTSNGCSDYVTLTVQQHDDKHQETHFYKPSFAWRRANVRFVGDDLRIFTDGQMEVEHVCIDYIKQVSFMHNAEDFDGNSYTDLTGNTLTGRVHSPLPFGINGEVVDIAVLIATGELQIPDYNIKKDKIQLNN